jgi:hypothetical protein
MTDSSQMAASLDISEVFKLTGVVLAIGMVELNEASGE